MADLKSEILDLSQDKNVTGTSGQKKGSGMPWYILSQDNSILRVFHILMNVMAVPSIIINLFL